MITKLHTIYRNKNGQPLPSVTEIQANLGWKTENLLRWAVFCCKRNVQDPFEVRNDSSKKGTLIHFYIQAFLENYNTKQIEEYESNYDLLQISFAKKAFDEFKSWYNQVKPKHLQSEIQVIDEEYGYGGTADWPVIINEKRTLADFKTGKHIYAESFFQLVAYFKTINKTIYKDDPLTDIMILHIRPEQLAREYWLPRNLINPFYDGFLALKKLEDLKATINKQGGLIT